MLRPLINRGYGRIFFWDGRTTPLEEQVLQPIRNPDEMNMTLAETSARVKLDPATIARAPSELHSKRYLPLCS
jgi:cytochrome c peroxidase